MGKVWCQCSPSRHIIIVYFVCNYCKLILIGQIKKEPSPNPDQNDLYIVTEDCAPPTEGEGIFYMRCGQVYDVISKISDWWQARLVLDVINPNLVGKEGWVAPSFLDRFTGSLEEQQQLMPQQRE